MAQYRISTYVNYYLEVKERKYSYNTMRMAMLFLIEAMLTGNIFGISLPSISEI